ncbi:MAG: malto-oligosyltrehalose synthase [Dehalococcoidia bacterium]|nr:malto-oligosyltrehalose synthase [Dehalococcoidia bacterium]
MAENIPVSTYRLQLNSSFSFYTVNQLIDYFNDLGVSHLYLSPCLQTRRGSAHGYAISDFNAINPDIGTLNDLKGLSQKLNKKNMGLILDFVPNHMSIFENPWWSDVLENGQSSPYAAFFDIDWRPVKEELNNRVLLPILEDFYGNTLDRGLIKLVFDDGAMFIQYHEHWLPLDPATYVTVLSTVVEQPDGGPGPDDPGLIELQSIIAACRNLPGRTETDIDRKDERQREKEVIKRRLRDLHDANYRLRKALQTAIAVVNGRAENGSSHEQLHQLLEQQVYRLSYWLVAADEINYRRFFDINELAALNMEKEEVFSSSHNLIFDLLGKQIIDGLRIDHVDGLYAPGDYLQRLQSGYREALTVEINRQEKAGDNGRAWLQKLFSPIADTNNKKAERNTDAPLYVIVEKILAEKEILRVDWPVCGTTGYEYGDTLNGIFINRRKTGAMLGIYRSFIDREIKFHDVVYWSKNLVLQTSMAAELNLLAHDLDKISELSRHNRDFTLNNIRDALRTVIACFPVYRTYISAYDNQVDDNDSDVIVSAVAAAKKRNISINDVVFDFISDSLLLKFPSDMDAEGREAQRLFVMRFQQLTGPVMAKGMEDTCFYIFVPLISLNEVGGNPLKFGNPVDKFHADNLQRISAFPYSMISTSTHDSKRSEDVRSRINVLSELTGQWQEALKKWSDLNAGKKTEIDGEPVPDANEEYYLYQVLVGSYPFSLKDAKTQASYTQRIKNHAVKALREAKVHSTWLNPELAYEEACSKFIDELLDPAPDNLFLADFREFNSTVSICGMYNSLSQTALKIFSPGVPDIYRGNEVWIFDLTDPDNRRPVDFTRRRKMLEGMQKHLKTPGEEISLCEEMLNSMEDGRIKLYVTWKSLVFRRDNKTLFHSRTYLPLSAKGERKNHICAFMRRDEDREVIIAAPVLLAGLTSRGESPPLGAAIWGNTQLNLPKACAGKIYRNIFTGEKLTASEKDGAAVMELAAVFKTFPVAALELAGG